MGDDNEKKIGILKKCTKSNTPKWTLKGKSPGKCLSIYDGDTAHFAFFAYEGSEEPYEASCRFIGFDCAEKRSKEKDPIKKEKEEAEAKVAQERLRKLLFDDKTGDAHIVQLQFEGCDKYGRPLVRVVCPEGDVCEIMIREGLANPYDGRGPKAHR